MRQSWIGSQTDVKLVDEACAGLRRTVASEFADVLQPPLPSSNSLWNCAQKRLNIERKRATEGKLDARPHDVQ